MRTKTITLRIPWPLWEAYEKHAVEVGYENATKMLIWAPFYSLLVGVYHYLTAPLSQMPAKAQDEAIDKAVGSYSRGEFQHRSMFESIFQDIVSMLGVAITPELRQALVAGAVRMRYRDKKEPDDAQPTG